MIQDSKHRSLDHALRSDRLCVERHRASPAERPAGREASKQSPCSQRHLLGVARGRAWRDLPERYGPYTTVYNRFNRWRKADIWDRLRHIDRRGLRPQNGRACLSGLRKLSVDKPLRPRGVKLATVGYLTGLNGMQEQLVPQVRSSRCRRFARANLSSFS